MTTDDIERLVAQLAADIHGDVLAAGIRGGWKPKHLTPDAREKLARMAVADAHVIVRASIASSTR